MKIETLLKTPWVSLRRMIDPDDGITGYDYLHENRCDGKIVAILPYRRIGEKIEYLLRNEVTPPWGWRQAVSSITGGVENNDVLGTAIHEVAEEAGYEVYEKEMIPLGTCRGTKSCDTMYYLYTVDLSNKDKTLDGSGDGSELERKAECFWADSIDNAVDPLVYVIKHKLINHLIGG